MVALDRADRGERRPRYPGLAGGLPVQAQVAGGDSSSCTGARGRFDAGAGTGVAGGNDGQHGAEGAQADHRHGGDRSDRQCRRWLEALGAHAQARRCVWGCAQPALAAPGGTGGGGTGCWVGASGGALLASGAMTAGLA